jgi:hypothetical protein
MAWARQESPSERAQQVWQVQEQQRTRRCYRQVRCEVQAQQRTRSRSRQVFRVARPAYELNTHNVLEELLAVHRSSKSSRSHQVHLGQRQGQ